MSDVEWREDEDASNVTLICRPLPGELRRNVLRINGGRTLRWPPEEQAGRLAVLEHGCVDLVCRSGGRLRLEEGAVFALPTAGLAALHNPGTGTAVIATVLRPVPPTTDRPADAGPDASPAPPHRGVAAMQMKLELVPVPVTDIDRAKAFYIDQVGFTLDVDVQPTEGMRVVQLSPPGSACSILIGSGMGEISDMPPGSVKGLHLVVPALEAAVEELRGRQVEVSDITDMGGGVRYAYFADPDHNTWALQEMAWRTGDQF